jgi:HK97 family phage major capsid protein
MPMTTPTRPPKDDLFRAMQSGISSDDGRTLTIRLAPADAWAEIDSVTEGHFMERFRLGAYRKTMAESPPKILFQHGRDPQVGEKIIASTDETGEDEISPFARGQILDGLPELVVDGLRKGVYGSSHRFSVVREDFQPKPKAGAHNPKGLPERTITEARLFELSPVTWPAYAQASASLRSLTDEFRLGGIAADPARLRELVAYIEPDAPSVDAAASPHLDPERRETPVAPTPVSKGKPTVEYVTREEKASRVTELKAALARQAIEYPGVLPTDAQTTWDADNAELDTLERDIKAWDSRQARLAVYAQDEKKVERTYEPVASFGRKTEGDIYDLDVLWNRSRSPEQRDQTLRDNAMRSVEQSTFPHPKADQAAFRDHITTLLDYGDSPEKELAHRILVTGSPIYRRAFNKAIVGIPLSPEETRAAALAVTGTTTTGGWMVPYVFDPTLIPIGAAVTNPFRAHCRVEQLVGGNAWTAVSSTAVVAIYEAEAAAATEAGPTIGRPTMTAQRASTFISLSTETLQDRPGLPGELAVLIQEGKDVLEEAQYAGGTGGTVYPFGMFYTGAFTNLDSITDNVTAVADIYAIEAALPMRYRRNAKWFMSRATLHKWQAFETVFGTYFGGQNYAYAGTPVDSSNGDTGVRLLGYPIIEVPSAPHGAANFTTDGVIHTVFGDPKTYVIVDRVGMNIEVIPHLFDGAGKPKGQRGIFAMWRNTARPIIDGSDGMVSFSVQ